MRQAVWISTCPLRSQGAYCGEASCASGRASKVCPEPAAWASYWISGAGCAWMLVQPIFEGAHWDRVDEALMTNHGAGTVRTPVSSCTVTSVCMQRVTFRDAID